jgi:hypothetical protein
MIVVDNVTLSKNPVETGEIFIIQIEVREEMADWQDVSAKTWSNILQATWDKVRRKIF